MNTADRPAGAQREETHSFRVSGEEDGLRLDAFLAGRLRPLGLSRTRVKEIIRLGGVTVDGAPETSPKRALASGSEARISAPARETGLTPEAGDLRIVYRDAELAVIDKAAGMAAHPAPGLTAGTLAHRLAAHFPELAAQGGLRPGIVHRLDKDTSGLMLAALTERCRLALAAMFAGREIYKEYLALARGTPERAHGVIDAPVGRHPERRTMMAVTARGRTAKSSWRVLHADPRGRFSLLAVRIYSGRTHQVRVHLRHIGHPLWGDALYGEGRPTREAPHPGAPARQMLHAWKLGFAHPFPEAMAPVAAPGPLPGGEKPSALPPARTREPVEIAEGRLFFCCPPPPDFAEAALFLSRECLRAVITGLPGCGKSSLLDALRRTGMAVFSADEEVRRLYAPGGDGQRLLRAAFGERFTAGADAPVDKAALARAMREDAFLRREVEALVHPLVRHAASAFWREQETRGAELAAAEIPLYLEAGYGVTARRARSPSRTEGGLAGGPAIPEGAPAAPEAAHVLVGVHCPCAVRRERLLRTRGWSGEDAAFMDAWQWPEAKKMAACDLIVDNSGAAGDMPARAEELIARLRAVRREREERLAARLAALWS
jgi:23S rRNA pseudouridine1911/1915/1917 synthase